MQKLEHQLKVDKDLEQFELRTRCDQLTRTITALESQLQQQQQWSSTSVKASDLDGEVGGVRGGVSGDHKLGELLSHVREIEDQLLQCQKENVRLRFEYEQAIVELPRLQVGGTSHVTCIG